MGTDGPVYDTPPRFVGCGGMDRLRGGLEYIHHTSAALKGQAMTLTYQTQTMNGSKWYKCTAEGRESGQLRRGVSGWHPTKGLAKSDAMSNIESVLI